MVCKGVECIRHKALKPVGVGRYESGQKRCQTCEIFINFAGKKCPCCNTLLRTLPRNGKYKKPKVSEYGVNMKNDNS